MIIWAWEALSEHFLSLQRFYQTSLKPSNAVKVQAIVVLEPGEIIQIEYNYMVIIIQIFILTLEP